MERVEEPCVLARPEIACERCCPDGGAGHDDARPRHVQDQGRAAQIVNVLPPSVVGVDAYVSREIACGAVEVVFVHLNVLGPVGLGLRVRGGLLALLGAF